MDFSSSSQESVTAASEDRSTTTDLSLLTSKETVTSHILTTDLPESIDTPTSATEDTVSPAETEAVRSYVEEAVDEPTAPVTSSPRNDAREPRLKAASQLESVLQAFQTLRAEMASQLETANVINADVDSTTVEQKMIIRRLRESLELGIGEMEASIAHMHLQ